MAEVNGLTSLQRNSPHANRKQGRQGRQRQDNRQVSLRPSASQAQRFTRPQEGQVDIQAAQLADSLQRISPTLGKLSTYMAEKQRKDAAQRAQVEHQQLTIDQAKELVNSGQMAEHENPYFQEAFQKQYGVRLGLHEGRKLATQFHQTYDPRKGGVEQFIAENMKTDIEGISQNPLVEEGFSNAMSETLTSLRDEATKRTAETFHKDKLDGVFEVFDAEFSRALEGANTAEEREQAINQAHETIRKIHYPENKEALNLSNSEQDALVMQVAAKYARDGDVDVVEKLLTDKRDGVGAIIDKRGKAGAEASGILNEAIKNFEADNRKRTFDTRMDFFNQSERGQMDEDELVQWHKETPGALTDAKVQALIRKNRYAQEQRRKELKETQATRELQRVQHQERTDMVSSGMEALLAGQSHNMPNMAVTNDQGEVEVMDGEDIIEETKTYLHDEWVHQQVADLPEDVRGEAAFNLLTDIYSKNPNLVNEEWEAALSNAPGALSAAGALDGESIPPKLKEGFTLYERLSARNPGLRDSLITAKDKDVYESIRIGQQYMGLSFEKAVGQAYRHQTNQDIDENPSIRARYDEVDNAVANLNGFMDGWGNLKNDSYVSTELRNIGRFIARAGGPTNLKEATKRFKEEHEFINGYAVPVKGMNVPADFKTLAEEKIRAYVETHEDEGLSAGDVSVFPISGSGTSGVWALVDNTTASPLGDQLDSQFTLAELQREAKQKRSDAADAAVEGANSGLERTVVKDGNALKSMFDANTRQPTKQPEPGPVPEPEPVGPPKMPDDIDPQIRGAVELFREQGITQSYFDDFLKRYRNQGGENWDMDMSFGVNPTVREKIRKYLPKA